MAFLSSFKKGWFEEEDEPIYNLFSFLGSEEQEHSGLLTKKKVNENFEKIGDYLNFLIAYPDILVDIMTPHKSKFHLYFFQRIMLRAMRRNVNVFDTASRGTSKSFLAYIDRYTNCMEIPHHFTTVTAGTNKQAAEIVKQKISDDLWVKFPLLSNEMQKRKVAGKLQDAYNMGKDYVELRFKNGSSLGLGNVRGLRKHSLVLEEIIEQDETTVNEVYLPLLNKERNNCFGLVNPDEPQAQQIYITTAGYAQTFAYNKLIEILCRSVIDPRHYIIITSSFKIPLFCHLTGPGQIQDIMSSPSFSKASFEREYCSIWSDAPNGAVFNSSLISALRQVKRVELKDKRSKEAIDNKEFYVIAADIAKDGSADTAIIVSRVIPKDYYFTFKFVNLQKINSTDFMFIANLLKEMVLQYNARMLIYDANGIGSGLRDWLNKETVNEQGFKMQGLGIINPPTNAVKDVIRYPKDKTLCYEIKSGGTKGEEIHYFFFSRMSTGAITFPIKLTEAQTLYASNKTFFQLGRKKQEEILKPYQIADIMDMELKNLDVINTGDNMTNRTKIIRRNPSIQKDFFSAAEYLIYGVNQYIEMNYYKTLKSKKNNRVDAFIFE